MAKTYHVEVVITAKHYSSVTVTSEEGEDEQDTLRRAEQEAESLIIRGEDDEAQPEILEIELESWAAGEDEEDEDEEQTEEGLGTATA